MRRRTGFTLIELMIVIAIIAVIAAIAIPGLIASQRASNERNAATSLKTLASAEADFRGNDRDGNKIQDFWTADVSGLYGVLPVGSTEMIRLIDITIAAADYASDGNVGLPPTPGLDEVDRNAYALPAPKSSYWYQRMLTDENGNPYRVNTRGVENTAGALASHSLWNLTKFGFYAFPESYSGGRSVYFINEGNTMFRRPMNGPVKPPSAAPSPAGIVLLTGASALLGSHPAEEWPSESVLKLQYAKLD